MVTIQVNFRSIQCMESQYYSTYISPPICTNGLIFSSWAFFILFVLYMLTNPIISHNFVLFEVITSPLYSTVIYSGTERQMIPQSFTQRLLIFYF